MTTNKRFLNNKTIAMLTGNEPAMAEITTDLEPNGLNNTYSYGGLTIRQHFAAMAMQGILANDWSQYRKDDPECDLIAKVAVSYADALIKELNKTL